MTAPDRIAPVTFPEPWRGSDLDGREPWLRHLTQAEINSLEAGLEAFLRSGKGLLQTTREDFPFQGLEGLFAELRHRLAKELGLVIMRPLPVLGRDVDEARALFWGIANHLGVPRPQGRDSGLLKDVRDAGGAYRSATGRGYNTSAELDYHTDFADLVGLLCLRDAKEGGLSRVVNSIAVHNEMLRVRPDLVRELYLPLPYSRQGEHAADEAPYYMAPIFSVEQGAFCCRYTRNHIRHIAAIAGAPRPSAGQEAAMDLFDELAASAEFRLETRLKPGDFQFLNNHITLHARTNYVDHDAPVLKRHLLRVWISTPDSQPLSPLLADAIKDVRPGAVRGGIKGQAFEEEKLAFTRSAAASHRMPLAQAAGGS